jgi:hypothetical protein
MIAILENELAFPHQMPVRDFLDHWQQDQPTATSHEQGWSIAFHDTRLTALQDLEDCEGHVLTLRQSR